MYSRTIFETREKWNPFGWFETRELIEIIN